MRSNHRRCFYRHGVPEKQICGVWQLKTADQVGHPDLRITMLTREQFDWTRRLAFRLSGNELHESHRECEPGKLRRQIPRPEIEQPPHRQS
jgi:hypothetical protein